MSEPDDLWTALGPVLDRDEGFVLATVVSTSSSAPRPVGTQMAVLGDGAVVGSLSGGCVEADVHARAQEVAATGRPELQDYGYSDAAAFAVGLTCGGSIRVFLERVGPADLGSVRRLAATVTSGEAVASVTALSGPALGWRGTVTARDPAAASEAPLAQAAALLRESRSGVVTVPGTGAAPSSDYFVRSYPGPARLVVFGSNAFAAALARQAAVLGYRVTVCDARPAFATRARFPDADEIVVRWPHEYLDELEVDHRTVLCALTHDPKFDDPLLARALRSPAAFVGAMGSRRTSRERRERLRELGLTDQELARLRAPFGLDLGGGTPEETAVSMMAEVISARRSGTNRPLSQLRGPIHPQGRAPASVPDTLASGHSSGPRHPKPRKTVPATRHPTQ
ncbi:XdhC family protein [Citricoccus sp. I39-566]|uniref:XdhC family protein n=1 Tax=Citricoccus sp. I39-566 TaxID=3073268 RepID=UPI00286C31F6|nr:XdhC family protein [Citricoccus sp. I39-566]WMY76892.1 XdhC family protein [Citricoccus sp. I39-566]